ncbi:MAG: hypothetical protein Q9187_004762 [Circinaria calcarea]
MADRTMTGHHSDLQLVRNDIAANAPERDRSATAPEVYTTECALEQVIGSGVEVAYSTEPPIVANERVRRDVSDNEKRVSRHRLSKKLFWTIRSIGLSAITVAIGLGVGLGVTAKRSSAATFSLSVSPSSTASAQPSASVASPAHSFLDDTSFAVAAASDGNRHVIFQDSSGAIRDAVYSHTTLSWTSTASWIIPGNARNHTPFSVITQKLSMALYANGDWFDGAYKSYNIGNLNDITTTSTSRALTVIPIRYMSGKTSNATDAFRVCLFYQSSNGSVSVLLGKQVDQGYSYYSGLSHLSWTWQDMTSRLSSVRPGTRFAPPFAVSNSWTQFPGFPTNGTFQPFEIYLFDSHNYTDFSSWQYYPDNNTFISSKSPTGAEVKAIIDLTKAGSGFDILGLAADSNETALMQASDVFVPSDPRSFGLWVKETKLIMFAFGGTLMVPDNDNGVPSQKAPASPFPFARFAAINDTAFYLYHQINSSVFAEDIWDSGARNWVSSQNISISIWN